MTIKSFFYLTVTTLALLFGIHSHAQESSTIEIQKLTKLTRRSLVIYNIRSANLNQRLSRKSNTNFVGRWAGKYINLVDDCDLSSSFLFRHLIGQSGNKVAIGTSHDGNLYGTSRDKGRRLEAGRTYYYKGLRVTVVVIYKDLKSTNASAGYGIDLSANGNSCTALYGAKAIRK